MAITDEKINPEEKQEATPSVDKENLEESIPYSRFKEVINNKNEMKDNLDTLKQEIETLKQQQPVVEEAEPLDWKEAENRAVNKAVSRIEAKAKKSADDNYRQEQRIEKSFEQLKTMGQEITPDVKKVVLTEMIKSGNDDVFGTYLKIKEQAIKTEKTEQQKKEGFVPSSQKGSAAGQSGLSYKELRATSLDALVERASKKSN